VEDEKPTLKVGYLPITHSTLPLIVYAQNQGRLEHFNLEMVRFASWPELAEAIKTGRIDAGGSILNTLAIKINYRGVPFNTVLMAVRDGSVLIVRKDIKDVSELRGKTIAIPSRFSPHFILLHQYLTDHGLEPGVDVKTVEMKPPDMVSALAAGAIDGYIVAEAFGVMAERLAVGRVLILSKDIEIPGSKSNECVIAIRGEFIDKYPEAVQEFVDKLIQAGIWAEENPLESAKLVAPFLGQEPETIRRALMEPKGRTRFIDLYPREEELAVFQDHMLRLGLIEKGIDIKEFVDERFAAEAYRKFGLEKLEW
ncbi:ABC transporter substrate-binding protein, partial [Candidatus Acetothermia bacterium]|nr:ABC transporter substrate-binding protein [Candidatus Acetothermia bacterium]